MIHYCEMILIKIFLTVLLRFGEGAYPLFNPPYNTFNGYDYTNYQYNPFPVQNAYRRQNPYNFNLLPMQQEQQKEQRWISPFNPMVENRRYPTNPYQNEQYFYTNRVNDHEKMFRPFSYGNLFKTYLNTDETQIQKDELKIPRTKKPYMKSELISPNVNFPKKHLLNYYPMQKSETLISDSAKKQFMTKQIKPIKNKFVFQYFSPFYGRNTNFQSNFLPYRKDSINHCFQNGSTNANINDINNASMKLCKYAPVKMIENGNIKGRNNDLSIKPYNSYNIKNYNNETLYRSSIQKTNNTTTTLNVNNTNINKSTHIVSNSRNNISRYQFKFIGPAIKVNLRNYSLFFPSSNSTEKRTHISEKETINSRKKFSDINDTKYLKLAKDNIEKRLLYSHFFKKQSSRKKHFFHPTKERAFNYSFSDQVPSKRQKVYHQSPSMQIDVGNVHDFDFLPDNMGALRDDGLLESAIATEKAKIPIVNIETPNLSGLPINIQKKIKASVPVYKIGKGGIDTLDNIHENIIHEVHKGRQIKDVEAVRKSDMTAPVDLPQLSNEYASNEDTPIKQKGQMSEEEIEALKEDQTASSLMKSADMDKPKEEADFFGLGKPSPMGASLADSTVVPESMDSNHHRPGKVTGNPDFFSRPFEKDRYQENNLKTFDDHSRYMTNSENGRMESHTSHRSLPEKNTNTNSYTKQKISDGESDFHRPVSEIDAFDRDYERDKFNDYEHYDNNNNDAEEPEEHPPPPDIDGPNGNDPDMEHRDNYHHDNYHHGNYHQSYHHGGFNPDDRGNDPRANMNDHDMKPIEYTMKGEGNVEDAISRFRGNDQMDPDKMMKTLPNKDMYPNKNMNSYPPQESLDERNSFHDNLPINRPMHSDSYSREEENMREDQFIKEKYNHHSEPPSPPAPPSPPPQSPQFSDNPEEMPIPDPSKGGMNMEEMLDPEKAQERAARLTEQAELQKKLGDQQQQQHDYHDENLDQRFIRPPMEEPLEDISSKNLKQSNKDEPPMLSKPMIDPTPAEIRKSEELEYLPSKNPRQVNNLESPTPKQLIDTISESRKTEELSPEDALHALNGKKMLNEILSAGKEEDYYGPPDAVVNSQSINGKKENDTKANPEVKVVDQNHTAINETKNVTDSGDKKISQNKNSTVEGTKKEFKVPSGVAINELENATVTKEVVNILESIGQLRPPSPNLTVPVDSNNQTASPPAVTTNTNVKENKTESKETETAQVKDNNTQNINKTSFDNSSSVDIEEQETKEAVHDLNIAISILEKKLALINEAKKSGNKKAIYIVDETLRSSKPVTKSSIAIHHPTSMDETSVSSLLNHKNIRDLIQRNFSFKRRRIRKKHIKAKKRRKKPKQTKHKLQTNVGHMKHRTHTKKYRRRKRLKIYTPS